MPLKLFKRDGNWHYRGTVAGNRLRGSTKTASKEIAAQIAAKIEAEHWQHHINGPQTVLTFPQAVATYLTAGKGQSKRERLYLERIVRYWGDRKVKEITAGAIKQSAIDIHPNDSAATRNRQVITLTKAIINL